MNYPDDDITVNQLLLDKMVTGLNDAHLGQKLYEEGKDLTMEKALHIIRIYVGGKESNIGYYGTLPKNVPHTTQLQNQHYNGLSEVH